VARASSSLFSIVDSELISLARSVATRHQLYPELVCAVVEQESAWNPWAIRYEPAFRARYVAQLGLPATEEVARSTSWGLMQVMGQVARESGFNGKFLSELCEPATGIEIGCVVLTRKLASAEGNVTKALLLWNGGANPGYPAEVLARAAKYRT
jgi:soluble lytic murein transglycosylase-like protein